MKRVLAVDPGESRIGIAVSDPLGVVAKPLMVLDHISRDHDVRRIIELAHEKEVTTILVGLPLDDEGEVGPQARKSLRLVDALRARTECLVLTWDESGSTQAARSIQPEDDTMLDARAAAVFLQDYLNVQAA